MSLGKRIREYRLKRGLTQSQLAAKLDMTEANISSYERDKSDPPSGKLDQLAEILGTTTDTLLGRSDGAVRESQTLYTVLKSKEERDIANDLERMMTDLESEDAISFNGEALDPEKSRIASHFLGKLDASCQATGQTEIHTE